MNCWAPFVRCAGNGCGFSVSGGDRVVRVGSDRNPMATYTPNFPGSNSIVEESWLDGRAKGQSEGKAEAVLHVLKARGIEISGSVRERVTECTDLEALETWLDRSLSVTRAEELFVGE